MHVTNQFGFLNQSMATETVARAMIRRTVFKFIIEAVQIIIIKYQAINIVIYSTWILQNIWIDIFEWRCLFKYKYIYLMNERIESIAKMDKCAIFENQMTGESRVIKLQLVLLSHCLVNLTQTFNSSQVLRDFLVRAQIFYMNPITEVCQFLGNYPFTEDVFIQFDRRKRDRLYFKFRKESEGKQPVEAGEEAIVRKSKERTIGEVRNYLDAWKRIYNTPQESGIYYTLQQAAEKVGLPKKTLDDYERQIRMAKQLNFDFEANKNAGMGVMRNFVRLKGNAKVEQVIKQEFIQPEFFLNIGHPHC